MKDLDNDEQVETVCLLTRKNIAGELIFQAYGKPRMANWLIYLKGGTNDGH